MVLRNQLTMEHHILAWQDDEYVEHPFLIVGKRVCAGGVELQEGMSILALGHQATYRLDKMDYEDERNERNGIRRLYLTHIKLDGTEGKAKIGSTLNNFLAIKTADVLKEHQELFYGNQKVEGTIKDGVLVPDEKYLVNWYAMFEKYFDILRAHPFRGQTAIQRHMPQLVYRCIEEFGSALFNEFIRENYVGKENAEKTFQEGATILYDGWFTEIREKKLSFPQRVLVETMAMTEDFNDAVRTVVFKEGVKLDIAKLII